MKHFTLDVSVSLDASDMRDYPFALKYCYILRTRTGTAKLSVTKRIQSTYQRSNLEEIARSRLMLI